MWNWFSLDYFYYPVSAVLWFWYKTFGLIFGPAEFVTWMLAVIFLVVTVRSLIHWPYLVSVRTRKQWRELQPVIDAAEAKTARTASG